MRAMVYTWQINSKLFASGKKEKKTSLSAKYRNKESVYAIPDRSLGNAGHVTQQPQLPMSKSTAQRVVLKATHKNVATTALWERGLMATIASAYPTPKRQQQE